MAFLEGITINEARELQTNLYSAAARRIKQMAPIQLTGINWYHEISLDEQRKILQRAIKEFKEQSMPKFQKKLSRLSTDVIETKNTIRIFSKKLDGIEQKQKDGAMQQTVRFDRVKNMQVLLNSAANYLSPASHQLADFQDHPHLNSSETWPVDFMGTMNTSND